MSFATDQVPDIRKSPVALTWLKRAALAAIIAFGTLVGGTVGYFGGYYNGYLDRGMHESKKIHDRTNRMAEDALHAR